MTYESQIEIEQTKLAAANKELRRLKDILRKDLAAYKEAKMKTMEPEFQAVKRKKAEALSEIEQLKLQQPAHEWDGKFVYVRKRRNSIWHNSTAYETKCGIVEQRNRETRFAANVKYGIPQLGDSFVRLLRADGKPGLNFEHLGKNHEWQLDECQEPGIRKRSLAVAKRIVAQEKSSD